MAKYTEKEFMSALKESVPSSLFLFYGADEYSKELCIKKALKTICTNFEPIFYDGQDLDITKLYEDCCSVSFFSSEKCICLRNPLLNSFSDAQMESLLSVISDKPETTSLFFVFKGQEDAKPSAKMQKLIKLVEKNGAVIECIPKSQKDAVSMIMSFVKKNACGIDRELAENLAQRCLNDMLSLEQNLAKLCAYASSKTDSVITPDAVENLTVRLLDNKAYEITKNILQNKVATALQITQSLILQQVDAIAINSAIASAFTDIYRVKMMNHYNHSTSELISAFDYKGKEYKIKGAGYDASRHSLEYFKNAILILAKTDILLKSTNDDKKTLIERALIEISLGEKR